MTDCQGRIPEKPGSQRAASCGVKSLRPRKAEYETKDDGARVLVDESQITPNDLIRAYTALADTDPDPVVKPR